MDNPIETTTTTSNDSSTPPIGDKGVEVKDSGKPQAVSIRCRRHKKRFNVPVEWLKTSEWLCPHCYSKLTPDERIKYAPKTTEKVDIRAAEPSKPIVSVQITPIVESVKTSPTPKQDSGAGVHKTTTKSVSSQKDVLSFSKLQKLASKKELNSNELEMECIYCGGKIVVPKSYYYAEHFFCPNCSKHLYEGEKRRFKQSFMNIHIRRYEEIETRFNALVKEEGEKEHFQKIKQQQAFKELLPKSAEPAKPTIRRIKEKNVPREFISDEITALLPNYRIECKKCGKTVPCYKMWFKSSKVLCPQCYSKMNSFDIEKFHELHPSSEANVFEVEVKRPKIVSTTSTAPKPSPPSRPIVSTPLNRLPFCSPDSWTSLGGGCSTDYIMHASEKDLMRAVSEGRISRARARIEMNRRKKAAYYNDLPDSDIAIVSV